MNSIKNICFFFLLTWLSGPAQGQSVYTLDTLYPVHALNAYLTVATDLSPQLTPEQILNDSTIRFQPLKELTLPLNPQKTYWGKVFLKTKSAIDSWYLVFEDRSEKVTGWQYGNGKVDIFAYVGKKLLFHKKTGADYPTRIKEIKEQWNQNRIFLELPKEQTTTLLIRIEGNSFGYPPFFNLVVRKPGFEGYSPLFDNYTFFNKVLFGMIFILLIYHLSLCLLLRKKVYIWFSIWLFISLITIAMVVDVGLISEYITGNFPGLRLPLWIVCSTATWFVFWFFGRSFIGTKNKFPKLDKVILGLSIVCVIEIIFSITMISFSDTIRRDFFVGVHFMLLSLFTITGFGIALSLTFKKDRLARYFGIGAVFATLAPAIGGLWTQGIIRLPFDPFILGVFLQIVAYSLGLAYRELQQDIAFKQAQYDLLEAEKSRVEMQRIKDLDDLKTKFFANISHEFRTPLALILGPLDQVEIPEQQRSDEVKISARSLSVIRRNAKRLHNLVDQLLDLSKIESGHTHLSLKQGSLVPFIRSVVQSFEAMATQKNISFHTSFVPELDQAFYDKDKLEKICTNLLSNAFKYTPEGGTVSFSVFGEADYYIIEVADTGKGMNKEAMTKIFERFYRVEGTEEKGSGIGLALTKELVTLLGGTVHVNSTIGKGTTFTVRLPANPGKQLTEDERKPSQINYSSREEESLDSITSYGERKKVDDASQIVLVVEDHEDLREYIAGILRPYYKVLTAEDGLSGERMAFEHIPNIIISDVMMPGKDGYALCHSLKSSIKTSHIPVILLTAKAGQSNKMTGLTQGADAYMIKPFKKEELLIRIQNLIASRDKMWAQFSSITNYSTAIQKLTTMDDQFFQAVNKVIMENLENEAFSVEDLSRAVGFSRSQFHRKLKALTNKSANQLIREIRLHRAKKLLESKAYTVSEVAYKTGYSNLSYFSKSFKDLFGELPSKI